MSGLRSPGDPRQSGLLHQVQPLPLKPLPWPGQHSRASPAFPRRPGGPEPLFPAPFTPSPRQTRLQHSPGGPGPAETGSGAGNSHRLKARVGRSARWAPHTYLQVAEGQAGALAAVSPALLVDPIQDGEAVQAMARQGAQCAQQPGEQVVRGDPGGQADTPLRSASGLGRHSPTPERKPLPQAGCLGAAGVGPGQQLPGGAQWGCTHVLGSAQRAAPGKCLVCTEAPRPRSAGGCGSFQAAKPSVGMGRRHPHRPRWSKQGSRSLAECGWSPPICPPCPRPGARLPAAADHRGLSVSPPRRPRHRAGHHTAACWAPPGPHAVQSGRWTSPAPRVCVGRTQGRPLLRAALALS